MTNKPTTRKQVAAKDSAGTSSPPRWVAISGALVAIGGLLFAVVSHFIPKPEPAKPPTDSTPTVNLGQTTISASGSGNVAGGVIQHSPISIGTQPPAIASTSSSAAKK